MKSILCLLLFFSLPVFMFGQSSVSVDTSTVDALKQKEREQELQALAEGFGLSASGLPVFGSQLFQGDFKEVSFTGFNPDYQISIGDQIQVMTWGAFPQQLTLMVDAQGNIFIPEVGPVNVQGVRNADLNEIISNQIRRVFEKNVGVYASLQTAQRVKVFVSGFVEKPGLYEGYASDSPLYFLDRANGIDLERGSFIDISIKRNGEIIRKINLYDFLSKGSLSLGQFRDGDTVFVGPIRATATVNGDVANPAQFEFFAPSFPIEELLSLALPSPTATHVSIKRQTGGRKEAYFLALNETAGFQIMPNDEVSVTGRLVPDSILITITGEHEGDGQQVLTYGSVIADSLARIRPSQRSDMQSVQLFRESVAERQKQLLNQMLDNLERTALNARSDSLEEAQLRLNESEMILKFVERGRDIQPKGQVLLDGPDAAQDVFLEDGDVLFIPSKTKLITVYGEVKFPNTQLYRQDFSLRDYVAKAGGYTDNANKDEIIVIRRNGNVDDVGTGRSVTLNPGDEIFVLPKPDSKDLQMAKDISTILYQIAIAARVVIGL